MAHYQSDAVALGFSWCHATPALLSAASSRTVRSALFSIVRFGSGGLIIATLAIYVGFTLLGWLVAAFFWALRLRRPF